MHRKKKYSTETRRKQEGIKIAAFKVTSKWTEYWSESFSPWTIWLGDQRYSPVHVVKYIERNETYKYIFASVFFYFSPFSFSTRATFQSICPCEVTWTWTCIWRERLSANALELLPFSTGIIFGFLVLATFNNNWDTRERLFGLNKRLKLTDRIFCCCSFWEASVALAVARSQPGRPSSQNTWSISPLCFPGIKFAKSRIQDGCVDVQKSIKQRPCVW